MKNLGLLDAEGLIDLSELLWALGQCAPLLHVDRKTKFLDEALKEIEADRRVSVTNQLGNLAARLLKKEETLLGDELNRTLNCMRNMWPNTRQAAGMLANALVSRQDQWVKEKAAELTEMKKAQSKLHDMLKEMS